jgi:hypothetical protein
MTHAFPRRSQPQTKHDSRLAIEKGHEEQSVSDYI